MATCINLKNITLTKEIASKHLYSVIYIKFKNMQKYNIIKTTYRNLCFTEQ